MSVCVNVCVNVCVSVCVSVCVCTIILTKPWVDFSETWYDDWLWPNLKHGLKSTENCYHGNVKMPKMVFFQEKLLELRFKTWYAYTTSFSE